MKSRKGLFLLKNTYSISMKKIAKKNQTKEMKTKSKATQQTLHFHVATIFPSMFESYFAESILAKAIEKKLFTVHTYALREYTRDKHRRVDGIAYGGGPGMVMWVDPIINCVEHIQKAIEKRVAKENKLKKNIQSKTTVKSKTKIVLFTPEQIEFTNVIARETAEKYTDVIFICGRYEGVDYRVKEILGADEWSIGPYVLTGGELPAMVCIDAIARHIPSVLHDSESVEENRVSSHKVYARPEVYEYVVPAKKKKEDAAQVSGKAEVKTSKTNKKRIKKFTVPKVLLSGNHKLIDEWKRQN